MKLKNPYLLITILSSLIFIPFLSSVHLFDWDEINFAEAAREMILTNNLSHITINFEPFWEKPPMFIWFQVICMKIFGINEFAARLPNAICGILTLNLIFYYAKKLFDKKLAIWWVLLYAGSFTPHFYFKSGIIDPWYNLFIFLAVVQLHFASQGHEKRLAKFLYCGILLGLAMLTKGPVAVIIVGLCGLSFLIIKKLKLFFGLKDILILIAAMVFIPLLWFLPDWINNDFWFTEEFLKYQADLFLNPVASHGQPWYYHPIVLIVGCFPALIISIPYLIKKTSNDFVIWMQILFWTTLILFSSVTTKIVHYSSLCYLPASFIAAYYLYKQNKINIWQNISVLAIGLLYSVIFFIVPAIGLSVSFRTYILKFINDPFAAQNILASTKWQGFEFVFSFVFLIIIVIGFVINLKTNSGKGVKIWLISNTVFMIFFLQSVLPKIENHVQGSIINFYLTIKNKDVYIETLGFKSYAHYFYTSMKKPSDSDLLQAEIKEFCRKNNYKPEQKPDKIQRDAINGFKTNWLLTAKSNKPVYIICKTGNSEILDSNQAFRLVMNKGGYKVFLKKNKI